jgi:TolB protein
MLALVGIVAGTFALAPATASAQSPAVAFTSFRDGAARVYAVNADGSGLRALTRTPGAAFEGSPAYSPDGRRIVYTCGNFELCLMNADGSAPVRLTTNDWPRELRYDTSPAWSPDGTKIAFVRTVGGVDGIWIVAPDGSGLRQLPVPAGVNSSPSFSADSSKIAFGHAADETGGDNLPSSSNGSVQVIGSDGSALHALTGRSIDASDPAWSPDGAHIAFVRSNADGDAYIYVMNADGSARRRLTSHSTYSSDPAWSPDSTRIVFSSLRPSGNTLYHVAAGGGRPVRLTTSRGPDVEPAWQPAGATSPPQQASPPATPPSVATDDARTVGVLLNAFAGLVPVIGNIGRERAADLLTTGRRMDNHARRIRTAARSLHPVNPSARTVRRTVLDSMRR